MESNLGRVALLFLSVENLEAVPIGDGMQIGKKNFCLARKKLAGILTDFKSF